MFDFEKLDVYQVVKEQVSKALTFLKEENSELDPYIKDQLKKASLKILINLSEGTGRVSRHEKRDYYAMSRSAVFESVSYLDLLVKMEVIPESVFEDLYEGYEQCSKMLLAMVRSMQRKPNSENNNYNNHYQPREEQ